MAKKDPSHSPAKNHFTAIFYHHAFDDHNNLYHAVPSIEGTRTTDHWPIQIFSFLMAMTETNTYLVVQNFFYKIKDPKIVTKFLDFCCELVWQLVDDTDVTTDEDVEDVEAAIDIHNAHSFLTAPHSPP